MTSSKIVKCPFCRKELIAVFKLGKVGVGMSRFYAYCKKCKCSINKSVRRSEEKEESNET